MPPIKKVKINPPCAPPRAKATPRPSFCSPKNNGPSSDAHRIPAGLMRKPQLAQNASVLRSACKPAPVFEKGSPPSPHLEAVPGSSSGSPDYGMNVDELAHRIIRTTTQGDSSSDEESTSSDGEDEASNSAFGPGRLSLVRVLYAHYTLAAV
ncbi:hypothetical protein FRC12_011894 [Ceratobasidium sp. 428]|nr:hypothetical protein FRC12_011894 [Ceratobasidium sp. 428]